MVALIALGASLANRARLTGSMWAKPMLFRTWNMTGQNRPIFVAAAVRRGGGEQAEHAADREGRADDDLGDLVGLAPALAVPAVEERDEQRGS